MIGKGHLRANGEPPVSEVTEESIRITKPAESEERPRSNFRRRKQSDLTAEAAKSNEVSGRRENRILIQFLNRIDGPWHVFRACKHENIRTAHCRKRLPQTTGWQQQLACQSSRRVHQENVQITGKL